MKLFGTMMLRAGLAASALGMAGSAQATEYVFNFGGTVTGSTITGGTLFGTTGTSLNGQRFTATITFNDSVAGLVQNCLGCTDRSNLIGLGPTSPAFGTLTINGVGYNSLANGGGAGGSGGAVDIWNNLGGISARDLVFASTFSNEQTGTFGTNFFQRAVSFRGSISSLNTTMINSINLANLVGFNYIPNAGDTFPNTGFTVYEFAAANNTISREVTANGSFNIPFIPLTHPRSCAIRMA
jgi:hypothetical protein